MEKIDEELVLFATSIAMQLAKGLSAEEIEELRNLINQISCSLSTLLNCRHCSKRRHEKNDKFIN